MIFSTSNKIVIFLILFITPCSLACYRFPANREDPCKKLDCSFGAECKRSKDGKRGECVCLKKCYTFGDSVGSRPVCASDGRDYSNECELRKRACHLRKDITVKFQGKCGKDSKIFFLDSTSKSFFHDQIPAAMSNVLRPRSVS